MIRDLILPKWEEYCLKNWVSDNPDAIGSPEKKVKRFLDSCAYFILLDDMEDVISERQNNRIDRYEIPLSSCPQDVINLVESSRSVNIDSSAKKAFREMCEALGKPYEDELRYDRERKRQNKKPEKKKTLFDKIHEVRDAHPDYTFRSEVVNTLNECMSEGRYFVLDARIPQYAPIEVNGEQVYKMDRVVIGTPKTKGKPILFYDMNWEAIDDSLVWPHYGLLGE